LMFRYQILFTDEDRFDKHNDFDSYRIRATPGN